LVTAAQLLCTSARISVVPLLDFEKTDEKKNLAIKQPKSRVSHSQPWAIVITLVFAFQKGGERECRLRLLGIRIKAEQPGAAALPVLARDGWSPILLR
jgi:hypothetical protein